jgi:HicB_like antitoxin of bacterial toxin-antitoxin system
LNPKKASAVPCPALPDCHSQGATRDEARTNIREAIQLWLEVAEEDPNVKRRPMAAVSFVNWSLFDRAQNSRHQSARHRTRFEKLGYRIARQSGHIVMTNGKQR